MSLKSENNPDDVIRVILAWLQTGGVRRLLGKVGLIKNAIEFLCEKCTVGSSVFGA